MKVESIAEGKLENSQKCGNETTHLWTTSGSKKKSQGKLENILRQNKNTTHQNLWDEAKGVLGGSL